MQKQYMISGMTCQGCVNKVRQALETLTDVQKADIQLTLPQGHLTLRQDIPITEIQATIPHYTIYELETPIAPLVDDTLAPKTWKTYQPLLLIVVFISGVSLLVQYPFSDFSAMLWMRHFMAGFFLVFSFFKLLNIEGFANSYQMYDLIARRWKAWAYIYPFVELGLGIAYLINIAPILTNWITLIVLGISSIGVIKSNLDQREIKCACLGDVFNLPMSTVTIVEDLAMVLMAAFMLLSS